ncbi:MAG TPA: hypothetical protein VJU61_10350 [Polyangiaceae bacterium]|nr:hypothetical protein [Polyangiaceae bacterium]
MTVAAGVFFALPACGGSGNSGNSGPTGAGVQAEVVAVCDALCSRSTRCDQEEPEDDPCQPECLSGSADPSVMRGDFLRGLSDCYSGLACTESDDRCLERVIQVLVPDYEDSPLLERCLRIQDQCGGFADDNCAYAVIFTDAGKEQLESCLNSGCDAVAGCIAGLKQGN